MTYTTKLCSLLIAILLVAGASSGVTAEPTDTETISVELSSFVCGVDIAYDSGSLGTWERVSAEWVRTDPGDGFLWLSVTLDPLPYVGCDLNIAFTGLSGPGGGTIAPGSFVAGSEYSNNPESPYGWSHYGVRQTTFRIVYVIDSMPPNLQAGTYSGQVKIDISNAV